MSTHQGKNRLTSDAGKTGYLQAKKWKLDLYFTPHTNLIQKG